MYSLTSMSNTSTKNFHCDCCNFNTNFKSQYSKHLLTDKHKKRSTNHTQNPPMETIEDLKKQILEMRSQINYLLERDKNLYAVSSDTDNDSAIYLIVNSFGGEKFDELLDKVIPKIQSIPPLVHEKLGTNNQTSNDNHSESSDTESSQEEEA